MMTNRPKSGPIIFLILMLSGQLAFSQAQHKKFPFTARDNTDGARYVWFIYGQAGFPYDYVPAASFPSSKKFRPSPWNKPQVADVAWWKDFVALYAGDDAPQESNLITAEGRRSLREFEKKRGPVKWFRYWAGK
jgi:hypothetical protein